MKKLRQMEPRTIALLLGLAIGLGIAVHEVFLLVALAIVLLVTVEWTVRELQQYLREFRLAHRFP